MHVMVAVDGSKKKKSKNYKRKTNERNRRGQNMHDKCTDWPQCEARGEIDGRSALKKVPTWDSRPARIKCVNSTGENDYRRRKSRKLGQKSR